MITEISENGGGPERPFTTTDIAVLVPTLNRPGKLADLLESLATQSSPPGRVVIVDGASNAGPVVEAFANRLTIEYHQCHPPGQLRQRNLGLSKLSKQDRLVALLDDDIVLEEECLSEMVSCWNRAPWDKAGVAFNLVNGAPEKASLLHELLGLGSRTPGQVLRSGMTSALFPATGDIKVQWLPGGATVWRSEILLERPREDIRARWAIAEDLLFSYPVGKEFPLIVAAQARAHHFHVSDYAVRSSLHMYHGRTQTLWLFHFVTSNDDLSVWLYFWTLGLRIAGHFGRGIVRGERKDLHFALGQIAAIWVIAGNVFLRRDRRKLLAEEGGGA